MAEPKQPKRSRLPKWLFPLGWEQKYQKLLEGYDQSLIDEVEKRIKRILNAQSITEQAEMIAELDEALANILIPATGVILPIVSGVAAFNKGQLAIAAEANYGSKIILPNIQFDDIQELFINRNVALIKTLPERLHSSIAEYIYSAKQRGLAIDTMRSEIQVLYEKSRFNASRIARDQIGKLNGQLTQEHQKNVGVEEYFWRTSRDERVRSSHEHLEGKQIRWDTPPPETNYCHPGEEVMCRCWAEAIFKELLYAYAL